jgi:Fe2+ or Zn2+ uptake regulation protein
MESRGAARATDPVTSHLAAAAVSADGTREAQCRKVLAVLQRSGDWMTYREIHRETRGMEAVAVMRRLDDLRGEGLVQDSKAAGYKRRCRVSGRPVMVWAVAGKAALESAA